MRGFFFDLDGTLADSRPGLIASFRAGLAAIGVADPGEARLAAYLGTPLPEVFVDAAGGIDAAGIERGIAGFRRYYEAEGIRANLLYAGVRPLLAALRAEGAASWVVTSKPEVYAEQVIVALGIDGLLDGVVGAGLAETDTKAELLARALAAAAVAPARAIMLGDRHYDVTGAVANGVTPVGALWGYGSETELAAAGCTLFARSADAFRRRFVAAPVRESVPD